jgi:hypothetical protein
MGSKPSSYKEPCLVGTFKDILACYMRNSIRRDKKRLGVLVNKTCASHVKQIRFVKNRLTVMETACHIRSRYVSI